MRDSYPSRLWSSLFLSFWSSVRKCLCALYYFFFGILQRLYASAQIKAETMIEFRIQTYFHQNHGVTWVRELELKSSPPYGSQRHNLGQIYQRENLCLHPSSCSFQYRSPQLLPSHMKHQWSYSTSQDLPKDGIHPTHIFSEHISILKGRGGAGGQICKEQAVVDVLYYL